MAIAFKLADKQKKMLRNVGISSITALFIYYVVSEQVEFLIMSICLSLSWAGVKLISKMSSDNEKESGEDSIPLLPKSSAALRLSDIAWSNQLTMYINGNTVQLTNPDPAALLANFIRDEAGLKGTKLGCEEGGCGACTVVLTKPEGTVSVNSCLRPLCANDGLAVTTVEGIGSISGGLSEEQSRLVKNNGTQCGFCTPGWITNMHALNVAQEESGCSVSKRDIETYLDGNICRCTGVKPIVQAFHTFSTDDAAAGDLSEFIGKCGHSRSAGCGSCTGCPEGEQDIEGHSCSHGEKTGKRPMGVGARSKPLGKQRGRLLVKAHVPLPLMFYNPVSGKRWVRPVGLQQLCAVLAEYVVNAPSSVQLVGGNTSIGVTKYLNGSAPYNTADDYSVYVDVNSVPEMTVKSYNSATGELTVGAAVSLNSLVALLRKSAPSSAAAAGAGTGTIQVAAAGASGSELAVDHSSVFSVTAHHLSLIANSQVRNAGSWAGNLMVFLRYNTFPSDAVLALATANAQLRVCNYSGETSTISMDTFMSHTLESFQQAQLMLLSVTFTEPSESNGLLRPLEQLHGQTFKIAQRARNAHAHVNAGFSFKLSRLHRSVGPRCLGARLVFGGASQQTFIAKRTEQVLVGSALSADTLRKALMALQMDVRESGGGVNSGFGDSEFRVAVMNNCLYRAMLGCFAVHEVPSNLAAAILPWVKPISRGTELFQPKLQEDTAPVGRPVRKLEGPAQATGEAKYATDVALPPQGLHGAIVFSNQCTYTLSGLDMTAALAEPGVVAVYTAVDIPGENSYGQGLYVFVPIGEVVQCVGAPLGVVVATSEAAANAAAAKVRQQYTESSTEARARSASAAGRKPTPAGRRGPAEISGTPIVNIQQAIDNDSFFDVSHIPYISHLAAGDADAALSSAYKTVCGSISAGGAYHFYMETQIAVASLSDGDKLEVVCGAQDITTTQSKVAAALGLPQNKVVITCPRLGGAFGGKITGNFITSIAAALCTTKLRRPVRIFNTRTADMAMQGGREAWRFDYTVGFSADGVIESLKYQIYVDGGMACGDTLGSVYMGMVWADNAYFLPNYTADTKLCFTNTAPTTSMRAPGVVQSCFAVESVIDRVAFELGLPPLTVQQRNFITNGETTIVGQPVTNCTLNTVWDTLLQRSKYTQRLALSQQFNAANLWRKKGISITPVKYGMGWAGYNAGVKVGVRQEDGTITVTTSGAEMGQGLNTKLAQTVAYGLGVDVALVTITSQGTDKVVNGGITGGSGTSEVVCQAAVNACTTLNERLAPYRAASGLSTLQGGRANLQKREQIQTDSWVKFLGSLPSDVNLNVEGWYSPGSNPNGEEFQYFVYAACVSEIELDVLSGEVHVLASELTYDCGQSLNPAIDIGQIEGAFMMGLGYFLTEHKEYSPTTALLETNGTWEYKPPMVQEIPAVFNVTLLKNMYNTDGILGSKAVGEPPMVTANSLYFAVRQAIASARADAGVFDYFDLPVPATVSERQKACLVDASRFVMPC